MESICITLLSTPQSTVLLHAPLSPDKPASKVKKENFIPWTLQIAMCALADLSGVVETLHGTSQIYRLVRDSTSGSFARMVTEVVTVGRAVFTLMGLVNFDLGISWGINNHHCSWASK